MYKYHIEQRDDAGAAIIINVYMAERVEIESSEIDSNLRSTCGPCDTNR